MTLRTPFPRSAYEAAELSAAQEAARSRFFADQRRGDDTLAEIIAKQNVEADQNWLARGNRSITRYRF